MNVHITFSHCQPQEISLKGVTKPDRISQTKYKFNPVDDEENSETSEEEAVAVKRSCCGACYARACYFVSVC
jgi:hypothetical protein